MLLMVLKNKFNLKEKENVQCVLVIMYFLISNKIIKIKNLKEANVNLEHLQLNVIVVEVKDLLTIDKVNFYILINDTAKNNKKL
jgi:hypothetical protein